VGSRFLIIHLFFAPGAVKLQSIEALLLVAVKRAQGKRLAPTLGARIVPALHGGGTLSAESCFTFEALGGLIDYLETNAAVEVLLDSSFRKILLLDEGAWSYLDGLLLGIVLEDLGPRHFVADDGYFAPARTFSEYLFHRF